MLVKTILNRVPKQPGFVYGRAELREEDGALSLVVEVRPHARSRAGCSGCGKRRPGYDRLAERSFEFAPLWGIVVFFVCASCSKTKVEIGFEKQERFRFKPAELYIEEERFYKYACPDGCGKVDQAEPSLAPKPIPGSMASASLLAHLIVSKLLDGLPIERIAKRLRRHGADLATSTLNELSTLRSLPPLRLERPRKTRFRLVANLYRAGFNTCGAPYERFLSSST